MTNAKLPLKSGDEFDALTKARKFHTWRAGDRSGIKRSYRRRCRRALNAEVSFE